MKSLLGGLSSVSLHHRTALCKQWPTAEEVSLDQFSSRVSLCFYQNKTKVCKLFFSSQNGTDYGFLVRQNSELLRALDELEKTCSTLREENGLLVRTE